MLASTSFTYILSLFFFSSVDSSSIHSSSVWKAEGQEEKENPFLMLMGLRLIKPVTLLIIELLKVWETHI